MDDGAVLDNHGRASEASADVESGEVEFHLELLHELTVAVGKVRDLLLSVHFLCEGSHDEWVVDTDTDDLVGALSSDLLCVLNEVWQVASHASGRECAWNGNNHDLLVLEVVSSVDRRRLIALASATVLNQTADRAWESTSDFD